NEIPTGKVQGYWVPNAEYWIMGNIFIEAGDTLQLDPGVKIVFKGIWRFDVHGTLLAEGTENDSIYLISGMDGWVKWKSLNFFDTSSISKISYAHIEKVFDGINYYSNSSHLIKSLLFSARGIQVNGVASPWIGENRFLGCAIPAVESRDESTPTIYKNSFEYTGIRVWGNSIPNVHYNTFYSTFITILCVGTEQPEIIGNIFYNCMYAINPPASGEINTIAYNLLYETSPSWGSIDIPGYGIVTSVNFNGDSCDIYFNLIEKDPLFEDPDNRNFHLLPESPCIDAGDPDSPHDPDNTIADMGAYFYDQLGIYVKEPSAFENKYEIIAIPNPNSGSFTISVDSPKEHHYEASLLLYSLNGILMDTRNIAYLERGDNNIRFSSIGHNQNITDGIYICILSIRGKTLANTKIIIINE
ncbi:MAG: right-handed parallel beta-helix repeat-containing protein, partial [Bacteroidales bacterium]|nr:right-handed parallel beta-helix repeat-containing protein [Bacteroidales bacterium]